MRDEGVIKFSCNWKKAEALPESRVKELIQIRQKLFDLNLIGVYPDGIGYGNLSLLLEPEKQFVISGSQTGHFPKVTPHHFSLVTSYSVARNQINCRGPIQASSESLTHAMIYETFAGVKAVIHVHSPLLWKQMLNKVPTTGTQIAYGTPQMAREIKRLADETDLRQSKILVMAGHEDGIITFGKNLDEAFTLIQSKIKGI